MSAQASLSVSPSAGFRAWTPSDTVNLPKHVKGVACLTSGNLVARNNGGVDTTFPMSAGQVLPIVPTQIRTGSTGTYAVLA